jgi:hypothetical protein
MIERAAWLSLHLAQLDAKMAAGAAFTDLDHRTYLAWANALQRCMRHLGLKAPPPKPPSFADVIAEARRA